MSLDHVDLDALTDGVAEKVQRYAAAEPFPHIVLDDVLHADAFRSAAATFPAIKDPFWKGYLHVNETKYANTEPETWSEPLQAIARDFVSPEFVRFLEELTGITGLLPDWSMDGGGLHQTLRGGHLNVHADFTTHHQNQEWSRRVNILLYLNEDWDPAWGGQLELWDVDMTAAQGRVTPKGNRMLVFTTAEDTFHGHPDPLMCPPDVARRSMALYYFTDDGHATRRSTNYRARPGESAGRRAAIAADRRVVDLYDRVKRRLGISDERIAAGLARLHRLRRRGQDVD